MPPSLTVQLSPLALLALLSCGGSHSATGMIWTFVFSTDTVKNVNY